MKRIPFLGRKGSWRWSSDTRGKGRGEPRYKGGGQTQPYRLKTVVAAWPTKKRKRDDESLMTLNLWPWTTIAA
eukprot:1430274-Amphidinium_carterae.1